MSTRTKVRAEPQKEFVKVDNYSVLELKQTNFQELNSARENHSITNKCPTLD